MYLINLKEKKNVFTLFSKLYKFISKSFVNCLPDLFLFFVFQKQKKFTNKILLLYYNLYQVINIYL
jgi:hypothetical protein